MNLALIVAPRERVELEAILRILDPMVSSIVYTNLYLEIFTLEDTAGVLSECRLYLLPSESRTWENFPAKLL